MFKVHQLLACALLVSPLVQTALADDCVPGWDHTIGEPGMNFAIVGMGVVDLGDGGSLYASGFFTTAGGEPANRIARWDGTTWSPLGTGLNQAITGYHPIIGHDDGSGQALYVGGSFSKAGGETVNFIARWDGQSWSDLAGGMNSNVNALAVYSDGSPGSAPSLYAGGGFNKAGGAPIPFVATWDGQSWSGVGGGTNHIVNALRVDGNIMYAAGRFTTAGGVPANRVARWDGQTWSALGQGINDTVWALEAFDDGVSGPQLYAGGAFDQAGGKAASRIARWDGAQWHPVGGGMGGGPFEGGVRALKTFDDGSGPALYAIGEFDTAGGVWSPGFAKWDGQVWHAMGAAMGGTGPYGYALEIFNNTSGDDLDIALYIGGSFHEMDKEPVGQITAWRGCIDPFPPAPCPGDLTGSGTVGVPDLLALLSCWGPVEPGSACDAADLTSSGSVGVPDLLELLGNWGECPQ